MFRKIKKRSPMNFFVSIGAGINQIPLIKQARNCGFQVIGVDQNSAAPGFYHCDLKIQESVKDYENIYIKLRELLFDGTIAGIMTKSYGDAIITTSYLCEKFDLKHIPFENSVKFIDKRTMSQAYHSTGIPVPPRITLSPRTDISKLPAATFPLIVKPRTGHAKTDVRMIKTAKEFSSFMKNRKPGDYIFEKAVAGEEIISSGIIIDGKYHNIIITDKKTTPEPYFVDVLHTSPSTHSSFTETITETGQKIAEAFEIKNSPMVMEFIVQGENIYLLEAVPEFGGEFLPDVMVPESTGYSLIENAIRASSGMKFRLPSSSLPQQAVAVKYITGTEGILKSFNTDSARFTKGLVFMKIFKDVGASVCEPRSNHDRIGVIICRGKNTESAVQACTEAEEKLNIRIEDGK